MTQLQGWGSESSPQTPASHSDSETPLLLGRGCRVLLVLHRPGSEGTELSGQLPEGQVPRPRPAVITELTLGLLRVPRSGETGSLRDP